MNSEARLLPLGDFKPANEWQTHVNEIFYGIQGPGIHDHFQTYVSQDHRLAHALAENYLTSPQAGQQCPISLRNGMGCRKWKSSGLLSEPPTVNRHIRTSLP
jgi:hypothetical protein